MSSVAPVLPYVQIALSVLLTAAVLLQRSESGVSGAFGGDGFSSGHHTRRGFEKTLINATIVIAILFAVSSFLALIVK